MTDPVRVLRRLALKYAGAEEGIACKGTAVESVTFQVRTKTFLSVRPAAMMLKLRESLAEAGKLAAQEPGRYQTGSGGWVTVKFAAGGTPPKDVLKRWLDESYRLSAEAPAKKAKKA